MFRVRLSRDVGFVVCICTASTYAVFSGSSASAQEAEPGAMSSRSTLSDALRSFRIDSNDFGSRSFKRDQSDKMKHSNVPGSAASLIVRATPAANATAAAARAAQPASNRVSAHIEPPHPVLAHAESTCQEVPQADPPHQQMRKTSQMSPANYHQMNVVAQKAPLTQKMEKVPSAQSVPTMHVASATMPTRHALAHARQIASAASDKLRKNENRLNECATPQPSVHQANSAATASPTVSSEHAIAAVVAPPVVPAEQHFAPLPGSGAEQSAATLMSTDTNRYAAASRAAAAANPAASQASLPVRLLPVQTPVPVLYYSPAVVADNYKGTAAPADNGDVHAPFVDVTRNASGRKHVSVHLPFIHVEHDGGEQHTQVRAPFVNVDKAQGQPTYVRAPFTRVTPDATGQGTEVRAPLTHVAPNPGGQGTNVRAPFTSVNKTPGEPARVNAPFTRVQNDGRSGNVSVHAPFAKVEKAPGQPAQVHAPFTKVNNEPKVP